MRRPAEFVTIPWIWRELSASTERHGGKKRRTKKLQEETGLQTHFVEAVG
jgi:hypothetical protein